jgi:hypothetical protein
VEKDALRHFNATAVTSRVSDWERVDGSRRESETCQSFEGDPSIQINIADTHALASLYIVPFIINRASENE